MPVIFNVVQSQVNLFQEEFHIDNFVVHQLSHNQNQVQILYQVIHHLIDAHQLANTNHHQVRVKLHCIADKVTSAFSGGLVQVKLQYETLLCVAKLHNQLTEVLGIVFVNVILPVIFKLLQFQDKPLLQVQDK